MKKEEKTMSPREKKLYLRKLDRECPDFGFDDAFQAVPMDISEKLSYLKELDKKFPGFDFYGTYQWYQRRKNINHHRNMSQNRREKLICEIFRIENPDVIEGYENVLGYH